MTFDSKKEADRYLFLRSEQKEGRITGLTCQVPFNLLPRQGKEYPVTYIADFVYMKDGQMVVEDVKSPASKTQVYILKRKLMKYFHGIEIVEV